MEDHNGCGGLGAGERPDDWTRTEVKHAHNHAVGGAGGRELSACLDLYGTQSSYERGDCAFGFPALR